MEEEVIFLKREKEKREKKKNNCNHYQQASFIPLLLFSIYKLFLCLTPIFHYSWCADPFFPNDRYIDF